MVSHDDECESCGAIGRTTRMRWPDGEYREMCSPCERRWLIIWRHFCEIQPRQANRVRAAANADNLARSDGGQPMTDGGQSASDTDQSLYRRRSGSFPDRTERRNNQTPAIESAPTKPTIPAIIRAQRRNLRASKTGILSDSQEDHKIDRGGWND